MARTYRFNTIGLKPKEKRSEYKREKINTQKLLKLVECE